MSKVNSARASLSSNASPTPQNPARAREGLALVIDLTPEQLDAIAERVATRMPASSATVSPWLSTESAAEYIDAKPARIHDLVQARKLTPRRDGRRLLFRRDDLDAYLEANG